MRNTYLHILCALFFTLTLVSPTVFSLLDHAPEISILIDIEEEENKELLNLANNVEFDFIYVLANMFENGIKVDVNKLDELKISNNKTIQELISKIYEAAGTEFNINSPKQLGVVLFEQLNLPPSKKTKTGYSTNEVVLHKLYDSHEIIPLLLKYREAFKLQSTYIEPL